MGYRFKGFGSHPYTLLVGSDEEKLYIPRSLLLQIPYFAKVLVTDSSDDARKEQLRMPDFECDTLADVIYFFWTKMVPKLGGCYTAADHAEVADDSNASSVNVADETEQGRNYRICESLRRS